MGGEGVGFVGEGLREMDCWLGNVFGAEVSEGRCGG